MMRHWTPEERQRQAVLIQKWKPWSQSTGATTPKGKSISKMNAYKHGARNADVREAAQQLAEWKRTLRQLIGSI
ncbi:hypothetical protein B1207_01060 [Legionella quinlivanii]|uniref:Uncharacterized protein n=1 Tax=Legionella quinlivanii TaxID=45073 RepID=A0A364LN84_9GAMM|nr:hypothetical protein B1207_01060 [Legionella quinlivanii]